MPVIVKDTMFGSGSEVEVAGETLTKARGPHFPASRRNQDARKVLATGTIRARIVLPTSDWGAPNLACDTYVPVHWARLGRDRRLLRNDRGISFSQADPSGVSTAMPILRRYT